MEDSACWARSSALISSISSSTWLLALNLLNAFRASSSHCLVMSRYLEFGKLIEGVNELKSAFLNNLKLSNQEKNQALNSRPE